jgi:hypothetical protein
VMARLQPRRRARPLARALALALAATVLIGGTAMALPASRDAILDSLGLRGVRVERVPTLPPATVSRLGLGERIPLARARHAASFEALLPPAATAAYLDHDLPGGRISVIDGSALLIEFRASSQPLFLKLILTSTHAQQLRVDGSPGIYLSGAPHELVFIDANGRFATDRVRIAGSVLIWQRGPLTLRLEGAGTLQRALALARSLR